MASEESCCCGNVIRPAPCTIIVHPCRCETPGPRLRESPLEHAFTDGVNEKQYAERKAYGLPVRTPLESIAEFRGSRH